MINVKNGWRSFQLYTTSVYAVIVEKYTAHAVAPVEIIMEFTKPLIGLKLFPIKIEMFFNI